MSASRRLLLLLALLGLGVLAWYWLGKPQGTATWLTVEAPRTGVMGQPLVVRVTITAATPAVLTADLHWSTGRRESRGFLSGSTAQPAGAPGSVVTFRLDVPPRPEMGYVRAVIYGGPTKGWRGHTHAATSDYLPIKPATSSGSAPASRELTMFDQKHDPTVVRLDSPLMQAMIAVLWAAGVIRWWRRGRALALACLAATVWEALPLEGWIGEHARAFAISHRWYADRTGIQIMVTALIAVATVAAVAMIWMRHRDSARRCAWLGLAGYAGVSLASLCSLHKVDEVLATMLLGVTLLQVVQLAAALVTTIGRADPPRTDAAD